MEGIQTIQALKAVQSSLPAQTTIPSDELVMLYAADGTPIAKIARDDLVKAVASVMASNSQTTFSKLLGVQANGTPMGIGASDLASVLGVAHFESKLDPTDLASLPNGVYTTHNSALFGLADIFGANRVMVIKCRLNKDYVYMAIDMEGNRGIYTSYALSSWTKQ